MKKLILAGALVGLALPLFSTNTVHAANTENIQTNVLNIQHSQNKTHNFNYLENKTVHNLNSYAPIPPMGGGYSSISLPEWNDPYTRVQTPTPNRPVHY